MKILRNFNLSLVIVTVALTLTLMRVSAQQVTLDSLALEVGSIKTLVSALQVANDDLKDEVDVLTGDVKILKDDNERLNRIITTINQGATGPPGPPGAYGPIGPAGESGRPGDSLMGATGGTGPFGDTGARGGTGPVGPMGYTGATGGTGPRGRTGSIGFAGYDGDTGSTGSVGPIGRSGATGATGPSRTLEGEDETPHVYDIQPLYGPVAGGTHVTVTGSHLRSPGLMLRIGGMVYTSVDSHETYFIFVTAGSNKTNSHLPIVLEVPGYPVIRTPYTFIYKENPTIQGIYPQEILITGGVKLTVSGESLDSVARPYVEVTVIILNIITY